MAEMLSGQTHHSKLLGSTLVVDYVISLDTVLHRETPWVSISLSLSVYVASGLISISTAVNRVLLTHFNPFPLGHCMFILFLPTL